MACNLGIDVGDARTRAAVVPPAGTGRQWRLLGAGAGAGSTAFSLVDPPPGPGDRGGAGDGPPTLPGSGPAGGEPPGRRRPPFFALVAALVAVAVLVAVIVVVRRGASDDATAASSPPAALDATTSSSTTSTTTSTTTTKPPATTTSTSTTLPPPIGKVALTETGVVLQYGTPAGLALNFGDGAELTIARIRLLIGAPSADTGWKRDDRCEGSSTRRVMWGDLETVYAKGAGGSGDASLTFQQWYVTAPGVLPFGVLTTQHIGVGSSVADLKRAYPSLHLAQPSPGDPAGLFTTKSDGGDLIEGVTTNTADRGGVVQMWAGFACQRAAG